MLVTNWVGNIWEKQSFGRAGLGEVATINWNSEQKRRSMVKGEVISSILNRLSWNLLQQPKIPISPSWVYNSVGSCCCVSGEASILFYKDALSHEVEMLALKEQNHAFHFFKCFLAVSTWSVPNRCSINVY